MTEANVREDNITFAELQDAIAALLETPDDEMTDEEKARHEEYLGWIASLEEDKVDNLGFFIKSQTARADFLKEESRKLAAKAKTIENKILGIKNYYAESMIMNGLKKISGKTYTLSFRKTPIVAFTDEAAIPPEYIRVIPEAREPDKIAIKAALKAGQEVPGAVLMENTSLQIR